MDTLEREVRLTAFRRGNDHVPSSLEDERIFPRQDTLSSVQKKRRVYRRKRERKRGVGWAAALFEGRGLTTRVQFTLRINRATIALLC